MTDVFEELVHGMKNVGMDGRGIGCRGVFASGVKWACVRAVI